MPSSDSASRRRPSSQAWTSRRWAPLAIRSSCSSPKRSWGTRPMQPISEALVTTTAAVDRSPQPSLPSIPWRDPHTVPSHELSEYIQRLQQACLDHPQSANLRTCLGMAHAMNYDVYKSIDALEEARGI